MRCTLKDASRAPALETPGFGSDGLIARFSTAAELAVVIEVIMALMTELAYAQKEMFGVRLALEEAVVNAIKHGHQGDSTKHVEVQFKVVDDFVLVEVKDEGPGYDRSLVPDPQVNLERPSGRGLLLIQHYSSWVELNERGNRITFCKYSSAWPNETTADF